jgi:hypothetical protein
MGKGWRDNCPPPQNLRLCADLPIETLKDNHFFKAYDLALMAASFVFNNIFFKKN